MKQLLVPQEIAEYCTLYEALHWIAFNTYPTTFYQEGRIEQRFDLEYNEYAALEKDVSLQYIFSEDVCRKYGLPPCPLVAYLDEYGEEPPRSIYTHKDIDGFENVKGVTPEMIQEMKNIITVKAELDAKQAVFDAALAEHLEIAQSKMFIALKEGTIKAQGREIKQDFDFNNLDEDDLDILEPADFWREYTDIPSHTYIPSSLWSLSKINWESCYFEDKEFCYCHIVIDTKSLFAQFPEPELETVTVYIHNGTYLLDKTIAKAPSHSSRGRPSYDWHSFTAEMALRFSKGALPKFQNACVIDMAEWCQKIWGKTPSETNLKMHIAPFYAAQKKSENT